MIPPSAIFPRSPRNRSGTERDLLLVAASVGPGRSRLSCSRMSSTSTFSNVASADLLAVRVEPRRAEHEVEVVPFARRP
jgi:hypothetical protein